MTDLEKLTREFYRSKDWHGLNPDAVQTHVCNLYTVCDRRAESSHLPLCSYQSSHQKGGA